MTAMNTNSPLPRGAVTIHRIVCAVENVIESVAAWNRRRRAAAELSKLDRVRLSDIGLEGVDLTDLAGSLRRRARRR